MTSGRNATPRHKRYAACADIRRLLHVGPGTPSQLTSGILEFKLAHRLLGLARAGSEVNVRLALLVAPLQPLHEFPASFLVRQTTAEPARVFEFRFVAVADALVARRLVP